MSSNNNLFACLLLPILALSLSCKKNNETNTLRGAFESEYIFTSEAPVMYVQGRSINDQTIITNYLLRLGLANLFFPTATDSIPNPVHIQFANNGTAVINLSGPLPGAGIVNAEVIQIGSDEFILREIDTVHTFLTPLDICHVTDSVFRALAYLRYSPSNNGYTSVEMRREFPIQLRNGIYKIPYVAFCGSRGPLLHPNCVQYNKNLWAVANSAPGVPLQSTDTLIVMKKTIKLRQL